MSNKYEVQLEERIRALEIEKFNIEDAAMLENINLEIQNLRLELSGLRLNLYGTKSTPQVADYGY